MNRILKTVPACLMLLSSAISADDNPMATTSVEEMLAKGEEFYNQPVSCWVCHGEAGEGRVGPSLLTAPPSAAFIWNQIQTNPQMGIIASELNPTDEDLVAVSLYIRGLAGLPVSEDLIFELQSELTRLKSEHVAEITNVKTERDLAVEQVETYQSILDDWQRRAKTGSLKRSYESRVLTTFEAGDPKFTPQPGKTYFYENVGNASNPSVLHEGFIYGLDGASASITGPFIANVSFRIAEVSFHVNGNVDKSAGNDLQLGFFRGDGNALGDANFGFITPNFGGFAVDSVPEPGTSLLMGMGVLGLILAGRASRKS